MLQKIVETRSETLRVESGIGKLPGHPDIHRIWHWRTSIGQLFYHDCVAEYHFDTDERGIKRFVISGLLADVVDAPAVAEELMAGIEDEARRTGCTEIRAEFSLQSEGEPIFRLYADHGFVPVPATDGRMIKTLQSVEIPQVA